MHVVHLSAVAGVVGAIVCAGRPDLGFGLALPAFAAGLVFIAIDAAWHATHPVGHARAVPR